ncbi:DUF2787 family protein [Aeromonas piscicola]
MTMPIDWEGITLPVSHTLLDILNKEIAHVGHDLACCTALTFHFRNPTYNQATGGVHPVEIRLIRSVNGWLFDYITDFSYQRLGQDTELCKELDFNFLDNEHYLQGWGPLPAAQAHELFNLWQSNFLSYAQLGFFNVTVSKG